MTLTASSSRWEDLSVNTTCPRRTGRRATGRSGTTRQPGIEIPDCVLLEARQDVTVSVERDRDARMAQAFTDDLGVDPSSQEQACVRMAQVMEPKGTDTYPRHYPTEGTS